MKKRVIIFAVVIAGIIAGYLCYDWYAKTRKQNVMEYTYYSWKDKNGNEHFSDKEPPSDATNVRNLKGYEYADKPIIVKVKNSIAKSYKSLMEKVSNYHESKKQKEKKK